MNIQTVLNQASQILDNSSNTFSKLDSEILLSEVIKKNRQYLILNSNEELKKENIKSFDHLVKRRKKGEPIAYLINKKEFWKQNFYINQHVLIPRPDTELLVEETLKLFNASFGSKFLTSIPKYFKSCCLIYGGLDKMRSYLPIKNLSTSEL